MKNEHEKVSVIHHSFKKGESLDLSVSAIREDVDENTVKLSILISPDKETDYSVGRLSAVLISDGDVHFRDNLVSYGGGNYSEPENAYENNRYEQLLNGENYIHYTALLSREDAENEFLLEITYSLKGRDLYFMNTFDGNKFSVII